MLFRFAVVVFAATSVTVGDAAAAVADADAAYTAIVVIAAVVFISNDLCRDETYYKNTVDNKYTFAHSPRDMNTHTPRHTVYLFHLRALANVFVFICVLVSLNLYTHISCWIYYSM